MRTYIGHQQAVSAEDFVELALGTPVELRVSGGTTAVPPYLAYPGGEVVRLDVTGRPETVDDAVQRLPRHVQNELREYLGRPDVRDRLELLHEAEIEALVDFGAGVAELSNNLNRYQGYLAHQWVTRPDPPENAAGTSRLGADLSTGIEKLSGGADELAAGAGELASGGGQLATGAADLADGNSRIADGSVQLASGSAQAAPTLLPWMLGLVLAGLIAIGFWVGHRISHRRALATA